MVFQNRAEAGRNLAEALARFKGEAAVILAIPCGGVPVGFEVARALHAPLDVCLAHKIGAPGNPEFAIGSVDALGNFVLDEESVARLSVSREYIAGAVQQQREALARRMARYGCEPRELAGKTLIVVDDGLATGATAEAALKSLEAALPARRILAVPVAAAEAIARVSREADEVVALHSPSLFGAVGEYYRDFSQVGDDEVLRLLRLAGENISP